MKHESLDRPSLSSQIFLLCHDLLLTTNPDHPSLGVGKLGRVPKMTVFSQPLSLSCRRKEARLGIESSLGPTLPLRSFSLQPPSMPNPTDEPLPTYSVPLPSGHSTADPLFSVHEVESPFVPSPSTTSSTSSPSYPTQETSPLPRVAEIDGQDLPDGWIKQWDHQ